MVAGNPRALVGLASQDCSALLGSIGWLYLTYKPLELREEEPRQSNEAYQGLLGTIGPYWSLLGRLASLFLGSKGSYEFGRGGPELGLDGDPRKERKCTSRTVSGKGL